MIRASALLHNLCLAGLVWASSASPVWANEAADNADNAAKFEKLWRSWKKGARPAPAPPVTRQPRVASTAAVAERVTSGVGMRLNPVLGRPAFHAGVDLAAHSGKSVRATADGIVTHAGPRGGYGLLVIISHGGGYETRYAHLSQIMTTAGARLERSAMVGLVGSTGRSTGPHLHYEVRRNGRPLDPVPYIKQ